MAGSLESVFDWVDVEVAVIVGAVVDDEFILSNPGAVAVKTGSWLPSFKNVSPNDASSLRFV